MYYVVVYSLVVFERKQNGLAIWYTVVERRGTCVLGCYQWWSCPSTMIRVMPSIVREAHDLFCFSLRVTS